MWGGEAVVEGEAGARGVLREARDASIAEAARGDVDDAKEGFVVVGIDDDTEVCEEIANFFAVVKLHASDDDIRDAIAAKDFFEGAGVRVHAEEDGTGAVREVALGAAIEEIVNDKLGFGEFVGGDEAPDGGTALPRGPEAFWFARRVVMNDGIGGIEDDRG